MIEAHPLAWPFGRKRTERHGRETARFETTFVRARDEIVHQVTLMVGRYAIRSAELIISTNIPLRRDGLPLANQREPEDSGVAIYFTYKKKQICFACDRWKKVEHNMQAIAKTIDALRGVARWGTGDMVEATFTGFVALPAPDQKRDWRTVLGCPSQYRDVETVRQHYRIAAQGAHPDRPGGSHERMAEVNGAWEQAQRELGA